MRSEFLSRTEKDRADNAEAIRAATESTNSVRNHDRLTESIQKYFGQAREQAKCEADELAAIPQA